MLATDRNRGVVRDRKANRNRTGGNRSIGGHGLWPNQPIAAASAIYRRLEYEPAQPVGRSGDEGSARGQPVENEVHA
ncbi:hypothetical protein GCM10029964_057720 [Kibdelosporangium lantanae]